MNLPVWRPARAATRFALSSLTLSLAMALGASPAVQAQTPPQSVTVDIAAMQLGDALLQWAAQTRQRVFYAPEVVAGLRSPGLRMSGSPEQSLARLLQGTGVAYRWQGDSIILSRDGEVASLAPVTVLGARDPAVTEGTGSYTTPATAAATGLSLSLRETPQSVSVVTRQRIDDQNLRSLDEVMGNVVGVQVVAEDSDRTDFWSRGFYIDSLQYDGVPTTIGLSMYGESDNDSIIYDRIEVVRGATGLMTGAGNPSASINLVRKHANSREFTGTINTGVGSWNQFRSSVDLSTPLNQEGTVRARMVALYQKKDSYIDLYHTDKKVFYGVIDADLTPSTTLSVGMDSQDKRPRGTTWGSLPVVFSDGTPTDWRRSKTSAADWTYWHTTQRTTFASLSHRFENDWEAKADWSLRKSKYDAKLLYLYGQPDRDTGEGLGALPGYWNSYAQQTSLNLQVKGPFQLLGRRHELVLGAMRSRYSEDFYSYGREGAMPDTGSFYDWDGSYAQPNWTTTTLRDTITHQRGAYAAARWSLTDSLTLITGSRYATWQSRSPTRDQKDSRLIPYAGVVYDINSTYSAYASYTDIFQPQDYRDRSGNYLDPVEGQNYEVGVKGEYLDGRLNASVALFKVKESKTGVPDPGYMVPGSTDGAYKTADGVTTRGIEMEVTGQLAPGWNTTLGGTYYTSRDVHGVSVNTERPRATAMLFTTYRLPGAWSKLTVGGGVNWQISTYSTVELDEGSVTAKQKAAALFNVMARYDFNSRLSAQLNVNNLFDKKYYLGGVANQVYYGEPRSVFLNLKATF
ncbi:Ferripyoverdine receptor [Achromobacter deleyi]|uniref:Ferripyoverdine receptor n=2 Tax=Achromobacter deleyi TaxID=1353891 RepID=A0A6S6ZY32_9BURK|nr:ferric-rhodotorulic acid/ferric-coprogen receptor FhuE [Achromobacter deleyi]CAB3666985.1 Ferripyoverdine receptor [Achromobacter deleyi]CAB3832676.1 Ferripyoverdine receptor [Achromobacter deleyi]CAB3856267.1 Ferripyoverdine receptor [Achromobacter deleyi]